MKYVPKNQSGMALLAVLGLSALLGVTAVGLLSIYENLQRETRTIRFHSEAQNLTRYMQNVLSTPGLCDSALRGSSPTSLVTWTNIEPYQPMFPGTSAQTATVQSFFVAGRSNPRAAQIGQVFSPAIAPYGPNAPPASAHNPGAFMITDMYLRRAYLDLDGVSRADGVANFGTGALGKTLTTYTAKLVVQFQFCGDTRQRLCANFKPGPRRVLVNSSQSTVDVVVAVDSAGLVQHCYQPTQQKIAGVTCGPGTNQFSYPGLDGDCVKPLESGCQHIWELNGFDGLGTPKCACHTICQAYYRGPPGTAAYNTPAGANPVLQTFNQVQAANMSVAPSAFDYSGLTVSSPRSNNQASPGLISAGKNPGPLDPARTNGGDRRQKRGSQ